MMTSRQLLPLLLLVGGAAAINQADAEDYVSAMTYVSLDVQGDNANSRDQSVTGSFGFGDHYWAHGTVGKLDNSDTSTFGDLRHVGGGFGARGEHWQLSMDADRYSSDVTFRQSDINLSAQWMYQRLTLAADFMHRETRNQSVDVRSFPRLNLNNIALQIDESLTGTGFGAHALLNITDAFSVSVGGMSYSYDSSYTLSSSTNPLAVSLLRNFLARHPSIQNTYYLNHSEVSRSIALLDSSFNAGMAYQFESAQIGIQYYLDKALETEEETKTLSLNASFFIGDHVIISPSVGRSSTPNLDDVNMAGLSVSYNW